METLVEKLKRVVDGNYGGCIDFTTKGNEPVLPKENIIIDEIGVTRFVGEDIEEQFAWDEMTDNDAEPVLECVLDLIADRRSANIELISDSLKNELINGILALLERDNAVGEVELSTGYGGENYKTITPNTDDNGDIVSACVMVEWFEDYEYVESELALESLGLSELLVIHGALK